MTPTMTSELDGFRRVFRYLALGCSLFSAILTAVFGWHQSPQAGVALAIAGFLVACSFASDYIWLFVAEAFRTRRWGLLGVFSLGGIVVLSLNLLSNIGSVGWQRDVTISEARVQNMRHGMATDTVTGSASRLAYLEGELKALTAQEPWTATVNAAGLKAQLPPIEAALKREANNCGRRKCATPDEGKGPAWQILANQQADLEKRIGQAEKKESLDAQIAALHTAVKGERQALAKTDQIVAAPASQAQFFASMASFSLEPTAEAETWTTRGIGSWIAIGLCVAPILFGLIGWVIVPMMADRHMNPRQGLPPLAEPGASGAVSLSPASLAPHARAANNMTLLRETFTDARVAQAAAAAFAGFLPKQQAA